MMINEIPISQAIQKFSPHPLTVSEAEEAARSLVGLFRLLLEIEREKAMQGRRI